MKVKREPTELKPLSEFADDRLELIKQAFACLKPKTIKGITPKFLQKESLESIQEQCLDEVLGISKKRLLSIINDTKCPSDTESSDDEDVSAVIEHISLDEISSDDDSKGKSSRKTVASKKKSGPVKEVKKEVDSKPPEEKKEYSVLELLELQARARAIRSQLAQEPVTKIELDDDDDDQPPPKEATKPPEEKKSSPPKKKEKKSDKKKKKDEPSSIKVANGSSASKPQTEEQRKKPRSPIRPPETFEVPISEKLPIRITRNFRKQNKDDDVPEREVQVTREDGENKKEGSRESSPEVMTIIASPETLCISSSDEEEEQKKSSSINDKGDTKEPPQESLVPEESPAEPEDGEIDEEQEKCIEKSTIEEPTPAMENEKSDCKVENEKSPILVGAENSNINKSPENSEKPEETVDASPLEQSKEDADVLCVQLDDDCIDLECDEPIEEEETRESSKIGSEEAVEILDSSADEATAEDSASNDAKSWGERWLESSKVSKVLAASKLSNQVRRKIKLNRKKKEEEKSANEVVETENKSPVVTQEESAAVSIAEEGSVEHYQKIVDNSEGKE